MKASRQGVLAFCHRHEVVLETLADWRPLDPNFRFAHRFFGTVVEGITDGIVCHTLHASGLLAFVHLDMLEAERIPSTRVPKPSTRPCRLSAPHKAPRIAVPSRPRLALSELLSSLELDSVQY